VDKSLYAKAVEHVSRTQKSNEVQLEVPQQAAAVPAEAEQAATRIIKTRLNGGHLWLWRIRPNDTFGKVRLVSSKNKDVQFLLKC
jgi:exosome complex RNA-binding protein Csl4